MIPWEAILLLVWLLFTAVCTVLAIERPRPATLSHGAAMFGVAAIAVQVWLVLRLAVS